MPPKRYRKKKGNFRKAVLKIVDKQIETKHKDGVWNNVDISTTAVSNSLVNINQGVDQDQRIGNQIKLTSVKGDFFFTLNPLRDYHNLRLILYIKKDISGPDLQIQYFQQPDYDKFTIVKDVLLSLSKYGETSKRLSFWKKMSPVITYDGTTGSTVQKNELNFYYVSDTTVLDNPPKMFGTIRTFYKDG